jgi:hypothetical protein
MGQGDADQRVLQTFQALFDAGRVVSTRISSDAGSDLPVVDPMSSLPGAYGPASPVSASGGALAVIQQGTQSTALFVLNPSSAEVHVELRGDHQGLNGRWVTVSETGLPLTAERGSAELDLQPWGCAVYRMERPNG